MKSLLFIVLTSLVLGTAANAEGKRVLVVMKSQRAFSAVDSAYKVHGQYALQAFNSEFAAPTALSNVDAKIENSLGNIGTLVLNVNDATELAKLKNNPEVALVEEEFMHPALLPFRGDTSLGAKGTLRKPRTPRKPVPPVSSPTTFSVTDKTPWGILAVKAPEAWTTSHAGAGARVMILDTGIDKDHPSLKDSFEQGKDFVGDNNLPYPFADSEGHGSHVAGTIAGSQDSTGFTGVAPQAKILMGRVCSTKGCSNIAVAQGINWAIQEKVDLISMSLGGSLSTPAERMAIQSADSAGVTVVAASGNGGTNRVSYPGALSTVIAVGAVDVNLKKADFSQYGPELAVVGPGVAVYSSVPVGMGREPEVTMQIGGVSQKVNANTFQGSRETFSTETNVLVDSGLGKPDDFAKVDVKGKFALISRGEISFGDKVKNAIAAGAVGAVIYNNAPGLLAGSLTQDGSVLPAAVFMVEQAVGQKLVQALAKGQQASASLLVNKTNYAVYDGTSMATPHVSGVVALIKATNKNLTPAQVKSILQSTAQALGPNTANEYGAGLVNAEAAVAQAAAMGSSLP